MFDGAAVETMIERPQDLRRLDVLELLAELAAE